MQEVIDDFFKSKHNIVSISDYIEFCLYSANGFYETNNAFGKFGHFTTSPNISSIFADCIGLFLINEIEKKFENQKINIVEIGSGNGVLINGIYTIFEKFNIKNINFISIDLSSFNVKLQQKTINKNITISQNINDFFCIKTPSIVISNELLDAYPVDQYVKKNEEWFKIFVTKNEDKISTIASKNFNKMEILSHIEKFNIKNDINIIEIPKKAIDDFTKITEKIKQTDGGILFFDYGYIKNQGLNTLQAIKNHEKIDILKSPLTSDITHLVDFSIYKKISSGVIKNVKTTIQTQKDFLLKSGIIELSEIYKKNAKNLNEIEAINESVKRLTNEMGELFKVLICI